MQRYVLFSVLIPLLAVLVLAGCSKADAQSPSIMVYKSPTCGCCTKWVSHLEENGFEVKTTDMPNVNPVKERMGVPQSLSSCHTAVVGGYVVEGHVPAGVVKKMLSEQPDVTGIAVPGMPIGSPGMEVPGRTPQPYQVIAFDRNGGRTVYATR